MSDAGRILGGRDGGQQPPFEDIDVQRKQEHATATATGESGKRNTEIFESQEITRGAILVSLMALRPPKSRAANAPGRPSDAVIRWQGRGAAGQSACRMRWFGA